MSASYHPKVRLHVGPRHRRTDGALFNRAVLRARRERINKAPQCISVTKLAVFHHKVSQCSYQLETIKKSHSSLFQRKHSAGRLIHHHQNNHGSKPSLPVAYLNKVPVRSPGDHISTWLHRSECRRSNLNRICAGI